MKIKLMKLIIASILLTSLFWGITYQSYITVNATLITGNSFDTASKSGKYYYYYEYNPLHPTVMSIYQEKKKGGINNYVTKMEDAITPYVIGKYIYYVEKKFYKYDKQVNPRWNYYLRRYDTKSKTNKKIGKVAGNIPGFWGSSEGIVYYYKNNFYITVYNDNSASEESVYSINRKTGKCKLIHRNFIVATHKENYSYKNYLLGHEFKTFGNVCEYKTLNLKNKKVKILSKYCGATYIIGKYIFFVDAKGMRSGELFYEKGYVNIKIKRCKLNGTQMKTIKNIKVNKNTCIIKLTDKKVVYESTVNSSNKVVKKTVRFKKS